MRRVALCLLGMVLIFQAFGGRLPERSPANPRIVAPQEQRIAFDTAMPRTDTLAAISVQKVQPPMDHLAASDQDLNRQDRAMQERSAQILQSIGRHWLWIAGPVIGLMLLIAGFVGRAHVQAEAEGRVHARRPRRQWRLSLRGLLQRPEGRAEVSQGWRIAGGILILLVFLGIGVTLSSLLLGTFLTAFPLSALALIAPLVIVAAILILFGKKIGELLNVNRHSRHGMSGCISEVLYWIFLVLVLIPFSAILVMVLMGLSLVAILGVAFAPWLLVLVTAIMLVCGIAGVLILAAISA